MDMEGAAGLVGSMEQLTLNRNLLDTGFGSDVTILAKGGAKVLCEKRFLIQSPVLRELLETPGSEPKRIIWMKDRWAAQVKEFLSFLYCQETPKALEDGSLAIALYQMGEEYNVPGLQHLMAAVLEEIPLKFFQDEDGAQLFEIASGLTALDLDPSKLEGMAISIVERASVSRSTEQQNQDSGDLEEGAARSGEGSDGSGSPSSGSKEEGEISTSRASGIVGGSSSSWYDRWPSQRPDRVSMGRFDYNSGVSSRPSDVEYCRGRSTRFEGRMDGNRLGHARVPAPSGEKGSQEKEKPEWAERTYAILEEKEEEGEKMEVELNY